MIQKATNTDQSARLIACGVDKSTADMYLEKSNLPPVDYYLYTIAEGIDHAHWFKYRGNRDIIPAWSLPVLLALLPPTITSSLYEDEDPDGGYEVYDFYLFIYPSMAGKVWNVSYSHTEIEEYSDDLYETAHASLIEAVVQMIETLTSHNRKLNEIKH